LKIPVFEKKIANIFGDENSSDKEYIKKVLESHKRNNQEN
jgi:hypothetical protein